MADIVERLAGPFIAEPAAQRVMDQAIEEIEHLREWNAEIALNAREFAAENERLRAALEPLACTCDRANGEACSRAEVNCAFWQARAALEEGRT